MELKPCAECGTRVTDIDISQGDGVSVKGQFFCRACMKKLDLKSDETAPDTTKKNLSDTQFFTRAGKMFNELNAGQEKQSRRRRPREIKRPRPRADLGNRPRKKPEQNKSKLMIIGMSAIIALLLLIIIIIMIVK